MKAELNVWQNYSEKLIIIYITRYLCSASEFQFELEILRVFYYLVNILDRSMISYLYP